MSFERLGRNLCAICIVIGVVALVGFFDRLSISAIILYSLFVIVPSVYFIRSAVLNARAEKRIKEHEKRLAEILTIC